MKKGYDSAALEAEKTLVAQEAVDKYTRKVKIAGYVFMTIVFTMLVVGSILFALEIRDGRSDVPGGCAVVDDISACYMEDQMTFLLLGETMIFDHTPTQVCKKKLVCYNGSTREWP